MMPLPSPGNVEALVTLKEILNKLSAIRLISPTIFDDHVFKPEVNVSNTEQTEIPVGAFVIKLTAKNADIKINLDRPITPEEYIIIPQNTGKTVARLTSKIYAQSLASGGKLVIEGLKIIEV